MDNKNSYTLEEILLASENHESYSDSISSSTQIMFRTKIGLTLGPKDIDEVDNLIRYVNRAYEANLNLCGGGYGCTSFKFEVAADVDAVELAKKLQRDNEFIQLAEKAGISIVISIQDKLSLNAENAEVAKNKTPELEVSPTDRVSPDGTSQRVAQA